MGELCKFTSVFPSAFVSAMTLVVTYLIGAQQSRIWGLSAVCFLLLTNAFVAEARTISLDQYVTLITVSCFYFALIGKVRSVFPLLVLGFAIRGPIGLVIPTAVLCVFYLLEKDFRRFLLVGISAGLLLVLCVLVLLGLAYHVGGETFVWDVLQMQVLGRIQDVKPLPWYFYLKESLGAYALAYPVAILVVLGLAKAAPSDRQFLQKLVGWVVIILVGLSIPSDKKIRYILPFAPALALLCGYLFTVGRERKYYYLLQRLLHVFCIIFPLLCLVVLIVIDKRYPELKLYYSGIVSFFITTQIVLFLLHSQVKHKEISALLMASFSFVAAYVLIVEPINLQLNQTREFVQRVEDLRFREHAQLVFYHQRTDGLVIKYLVNMSQDEQPAFVATADALLAYHQPVFIVATEENFQQISPAIVKKMQIVARGKVGREPFVVFKRYP